MDSSRNECKRHIEQKSTGVIPMVENLRIMISKNEFGNFFIYFSPNSFRFFMLTVMRKN